MSGKPFVCHDPDCTPVCDFCQFYRFNGDSEGVYIEKGRCEHPAHPHDARPEDGCEDYACSFSPDADPEQVAAHKAAARGGGS